MSDHADITWEKRIGMAVESWRKWNQLPTGPRMDRVFKESGVRDLVAERDEARNDPTFRTAARAIQEAEARAEAAEARVISLQAEVDALNKEADDLGDDVARADECRVAAEAERDEEHEGAVMAKACVVKLEDRVAVLEKAITDALHELGIPQPGYPMPVSNAVVILHLALDRAALAAAGEGEA